MLSHEILNISPLATRDEIKKAYQEMAKKHHPDKGGDSEMFIQVKSAYEDMIREDYSNNILLPNYYYNGQPYLILFPGKTGDGSFDDPIREKDSTIKTVNGVKIVIPKT